MIQVCERNLFEVWLICLGPETLLIGFIIGAFYMKWIKRLDKKYRQEMFGEE